MKNFKRFANIATATLMAACMVAPMAMNTSAADYDITVSAGSSDTVTTVNSVKAFKLFNLTLGDEKADGSYGAYTYVVDDTCFLTEAQLLDINYNGTAKFTTIAELLTWLNDADNRDANARTFADLVYTTYQTTFDDSDGIAGTVTDGTAVINTGASGYYMVYGVGVNKDGAEQKNTVISQIMLDSTDKTAEIKLKLDAPSLDKEILHDELGTWGDVGDNQIGENVEYKIITSVPSIAGYTDAGESYKYVIHDTMTAGLSFNEGSVKIYTDTACSVELSSDYYTVNKTDAQNFTITVNINAAVTAGVLKADGTESLYTRYNALLTSDALVAVGAPDTTNHNDNVAYLEYSNNPYATLENQQETGETPEVKVYDWTFAETITKVTQNGDKLAGATFEIYAVNPDTVADAKPLSFIKGEGEEYTIDATGQSTLTEITSVDDSGFVLKGLDDQTTYYIVETEAPDGYAKLTAPKTFILTADYITEAEGASETPDNLQTLTDDDATDGANNLNIVNTSGSSLPSTGGIGTTLFYLGGGAMAAVAGVYLISKKRMKNSDQE